jgi:hypothetical protein
MTVIALAMETGTYGKEFCGRLAEMLGLRLVDMRRFEREVAERGVPRRSGGHDVIGGEALGKKPVRSLLQEKADRIREETLEAACDSNVLIVGWSAAAVLRSVKYAIRIRIHAPLAWREGNVMAELAYRDRGVARVEIDFLEAAIAEFVRRTENADWLDPSLYHLTVDAEALTDEMCGELIRVLAKSGQFRETQSYREEFAGFLKKRSAGEHTSAGGKGAHHSTAIVDGHEISLTGKETHEDAIAKIERYLHGE